MSGFPIRPLLWFVALIMLPYTAVHGQSGFNQQQSQSFPDTYEDAMQKIGQHDRSINTGHAKPEIYLKKSRQITDLLNSYYDALAVNNSYYASYGNKIDSLKQEAIKSAATALSLDQREPNKTRSLKQLGYIYVKDADSVYSARIANALDSNGYRFPYLAHGLLIGLESGKNNAISGSYTFGYFLPYNKWAGEMPSFSGISVGYELNPLSQYGGFKFSGFFEVGNVGFGLSYIYFGSNSATDKANNTKSNLVAAHCLRPEIGLNFGFGQIMFGYNLIGADPNLPDHKTLQNVRNYFNTWNVGFRFGIFQKIMQKNMADKPEMMEAGLKR